MWRTIKGQNSVAWIGGGIILLSIGVWLAPASWADGWADTKAPNTFSATNSGISNTRHNLTMSYLGGNAAIMQPYRNDFAEVCVYCHTPHGANRRVAAPLWNRTVTPRTYTLYQTKNSPGLPTSQPGPNSLTCLSCHDGLTAIDSIINMPTKKTGAYAGWSSTAETSVDFANLSRWSGGTVGAHSGLNAAGFSSGGNNGPCLTCHVPGGPNGAPDFQPFVIGGKYDTSDVQRTQNTDGTFTFTMNYVRDLSLGNYLADDHPVGVRYPERFSKGGEYAEPTLRQARIAFFDKNGNGHADPNEVRLYDSGDGYEVECASCHDPHGVRVSDGNDLIPSFLRVGRVVYQPQLTDPKDISVGNPGSELCLTCHVK
ncbi:MAG: hypothetical protein AABY83_12970 [Pseudomonadota bacterium]